MIFAAVIFMISALGIGGLFFLKHWEESHSRQLVPRVRSWGDTKALEARGLFARMQLEADKVPPMLLHVTRWGIHELALGVAALARAAERQAHRLADFVSHKRNFVQRESKSEFLKQVSEYKNGLPSQGSGVDTSH